MKGIYFAVTYTSCLFLSAYAAPPATLSAFRIQTSVPGCNTRPTCGASPVSPHCIPGLFVADNCWPTVYYGCENGALSPFICNQGLLVNPAGIADTTGASGGLCDWPFNVPNPTAPNGDCGCTASCAVPPTCPPPRSLDSQPRALQEIQLQYIGNSGNAESEALGIGKPSAPQSDASGIGKPSKPVSDASGIGKPSKPVSDASGIGKPSKPVSDPNGIGKPSKPVTQPECVDLCTGTVLLPHSCDCQFFWTCDGQGLPILSVCGPGEYFQADGLNGGRCTSAAGRLPESTACLGCGGKRQCTT